MGLWLLLKFFLSRPGSIPKPWISSYHPWIASWQDRECWTILTLGMEGLGRIRGTMGCLFLVGHRCHWGRQWRHPIHLWPPSRCFRLARSTDLTGCDQQGARGKPMCEVSTFWSSDWMLRDANGKRLLMFCELWLWTLRGSRGWWWWWWWWWWWCGWGWGGGGGGGGRRGGRRRWWWLMVDGWWLMVDGWFTLMVVGIYPYLWSSRVYMKSLYDLYAFDPKHSLFSQVRMTFRLAEFSETITVPTLASHD